MTLIEHMNPSRELFSAITYYRKAVQLVPDIEFRLADFQQVKKKRRGNINSFTVRLIISISEQPDNIYKSIDFSLNVNGK